MSNTRNNVPDADVSTTGEEIFFGVQNGRWRRFRLWMLQKVGPKGDPGQKGDPGTPKRIERYTAVTNASGIATFTFSSAFTVVPDIQIIPGWTGDQMVGGGVLTSTVSGCTIQGKISRATLFLSAGPFASAGSGVSITIRAIGN